MFAPDITSRIYSEMKAKDLKILRKKLTKINRSDHNPVDGVSKDALTIDVDGISGAASKALSVKFAPSGALSDQRFRDCLGLFERNMGAFYRNSSWGLDMDEKALELKHEKARFLLLTDDENLAGFVHFRFSYDDEEYPSCAVLYVHEIQIDETSRRQGLGKKLMDITETIASKAEMTKVVLTVFKANKAAMNFYQDLEYSIDESSPSKFNDPVDYEILSRVVSAKR